MLKNRLFTKSRFVFEMCIDDLVTPMVSILFSVIIVSAKINHHLKFGLYLTVPGQV
jgi:hypothetical protein